MYTSVVCAVYSKRVIQPSNFVVKRMHQMRVRGDEYALARLANTFGLNDTQVTLLIATYTTNTRARVRSAAAQMISLQPRGLVALDLLYRVVRAM